MFIYIYVYINMIHTYSPCTTKAAYVNIYVYVNVYIHICIHKYDIHTHLARLKRRATIKGSLNLRILTMSWVVTRGVRWGRFPASSRICCLRLRAWTMIVLPRRFVSVWVVSHMSHIWMSRVTHMRWVMSHIWMRHVTHMNESCHTYECIISHIWISHVTYTNASRHICEWVTSP